VHLEASSKPHVHQKVEIFWTNIASTMAYPNSKNGLKNGLHSLGVKGLWLFFLFSKNTPKLPFLTQEAQMKKHILFCTFNHKILP
jgi:hypothetical protein